MGSTNTNLFKEFKPVSLAEWEAKILKDLKGESIESLSFKPEFDLESKAHYHPEEFLNRKYSKGSHLNEDNNDWSISEVFFDQDSKATNKSVLKSLDQGITGFKMIISERSNFEILFQDVLIEHLFTHIVCVSTNDYQRFVKYLDSFSKTVSMIEMPFLTNGLEEGCLLLSQLDIDNFFVESAKISVKNLVIDSYSFCEFGASSAQELGIALSQLNEYIQRLDNQKIELKGIEQKIAIHLGITDNYFANIAKFRAIKELTLQLLDQWGLAIDSMPWISGQTVIRHITVNDRHNNVLRQTSSAMAAILGGIDQLVISPYSERTSNDFDLSRRLAKNIQLVLKEESFFNQVIDPSAGAYAIESLTDQLIEKGWDYFMQIEAQGGYYDCIDNGFIHGLVEASKQSQIKALNNNTQTLLGVNKFRNNTETWKEPSIPSNNDSKDFKCFSKFNLESHLENSAS